MNYNTYRYNSKQAGWVEDRVLNSTITNLEKLQRLRQLIPVLDFDSAEAYGKTRTTYWQ